MSDAADLPRLPFNSDASKMRRMLETVPKEHRRFCNALAHLYETRSYAKTSAAVGVSVDALGTWVRAFSDGGFRAVVRAGNGAMARVVGVDGRKNPSERTSIKAVKARLTPADSRIVKSVTFAPVAFDEIAGANPAEEPFVDEGLQADNRFYRLADVKRLLSHAKSPEHARRMSAIIMSYMGVSVEDIAANFGTTPSLVQNWVKVFNAFSPHALAIDDRTLGSYRLARRQCALPAGYSAASLAALATEAEGEARRAVLSALSSLYRGYGLADAAMMHGLSKSRLDRHLKTFRAYGPSAINGLDRDKEAA